MPKPTTAAAKPTTAPDAEALFSDPDLVDRIFAYLLTEFPQIAGPQFEDAKAAVREEFKTQRVYVAARPLTDRQQLVREVLGLFNGRNATEVARRLRISRATVYRMLKQPGGNKTVSVLPSFETAAPVGCDPGSATVAASPSPVATAGRRAGAKET